MNCVCRCVSAGGECGSNAVHVYVQPWEPASLSLLERLTELVSELSHAEGPATSGAILSNRRCIVLTPPCCLIASDRAPFIGIRLATET